MLPAGCWVAGRGWAVAWLVPLWCSGSRGAGRHGGAGCWLWWIMPSPAPTMWRTATLTVAPIPVLRSEPELDRHGHCAGYVYQQGRVAPIGGLPVESDRARVANRLETERAYWGRNFATGRAVGWQQGPIFGLRLSACLEPVPLSLLVSRREHCEPKVKLFKYCRYSPLAWRQSFSVCRQRRMRLRIYGTKLIFPMVMSR